MDSESSGKIFNTKTVKRRKNNEQFQSSNNLSKNNTSNEDSSNDIITDDNLEPVEINYMAKNKRKKDKFYVNCYSKIIERIRFQTIDEISESKKIKINPSSDDIQDNSITKSDEIIEINSMSSCKISNQNDINGILKTSSYSSSELIDSSQSSLNKITNKIGIQITRPMLKNTIPIDSFEKYLNSLEKNYTKLSSEDKVMSWDNSSDISDVEDVVNFEERRKLLRLFYRNNKNKINNRSKIILESTKEKNLPNKKNLRSSTTKNNNSIMVNHSIQNQNNDENTLKLINSPKISTSLTNSEWPTDNSKDEKFINSITTLLNANKCFESIKKPITVAQTAAPTTNKLIQIRKDYGSKLNKEDIFKIPNVPRKYLPSTNNNNNKTDMVKNQKEEFYKYLGLGTKSSDNENCNSSSAIKNSAAAVAELKRRSLRVRRLQLHQQNNIDKFPDNMEKNDNMMMHNNDKSVKANGQLRLHQLDEFEVPKRTTKKTPKIQIICSVNSNTIRNKNGKINKNSPTNDNKVQNKSITSEKTIIQYQLPQINVKTTRNTKEINANFNNNNKKELVNNNKSNTESITDDGNSSIIEFNQNELNREDENISDSLIIVKRSYQKSPIPKILNNFHNNNNISKINQPIINSNDNSYFKYDLINNCSNKTILSENQINDKDKIRIEFSANYKTNINYNKNKLFGVDKNLQTSQHKIENNNFILQHVSTEIEGKPISIINKTNSCTSQNNTIEKIQANNNKQELKNSISDIVIDTKISRSSTPSECKVILEKLTDTQINNESINKDNNGKENIIINNLNEQPNFKIKSKKKNQKIWTKSKKLKILRTNLNQSRILRNKKIIKIIKKPTTNDKLRKLRKDRKNSVKSINLNGPAKIAKMIVTTTNNNNNFDDIIYNKHLISLENIDNNNIKTSTIDKRTTKKTDNNIIKNNNIKDKKSNNENLLDVVTQNLLPNPLKFENGDVLHAYYECEFLIVIQEFSISFWKYSKVIQMLGEAQEWELLGECKRKLIDEEIFSPYKNRICINDSNPVYIELRARQLPNDNRECNLASPYINIYYFDVWKDLVSQQSIQLDTIKCLSKFIAYTTIVNTRYFIMCWKQDTILGTHQTGLCKYALTPDLETLASIRDFKNLRHIVYSLECCDDDKLIGFGESQITIWDHRTGDVLTNFDLGIPIGKNLGSLISCIEFEKYLFIYQLYHNEDTDDLPELKIIAITISLNTPSFRFVCSHELPLQFITIKSSLNTNDYCIITSATGEEIWMMLHHPQSLLYMNVEIATSSKRFYSTGSFNFIEITGDYLNVKNIHENLLNIVAT